MAIEGPRGVRNEDLPSLRRLTDVVMREGLVDQYPHLFNEDNLENLRVCLDDGRCVSHVGTIHRGAVLSGCLIRVCCVGGVCTDPDYRNRGLASACFDDALEEARKDGVDIMIVSGDRSLYRMRGCTHVGEGRAFHVLRDSTPPTLTEMARTITVERMVGAELPDVTECYRAEPVRFLRPPDDYRFALQSGWVMNRPSDFLVIRASGAFRGYVIARRPEPDGGAALAEFAGDRHAILAALPHILERYDLTSLGFHVMGHDLLLRSLCEQAGLEGEPRATPGTVTLVNFPQLMERIRPRLEEVLGAQVACRLSFRQADSRFVFALGNDELAADQMTATKIVFGTRAGRPAILEELVGPLGDALRAALPLPTLWYGINYV